MKQGSFNAIVDKLVQRNNSVSNKIAEKFKNDKPFQKTEFMPEELIYHAQKLMPQDIMDLQNEFGVETVYKFFQDIQKMAQKRGV